MKSIFGFNGLMNSTLMAAGLIDTPPHFLLCNEFAVIMALACAWAPFTTLPICVSLHSNRLQPA